MARRGPAATNGKVQSDALDEQLMDELRREPRATNKALAQRLSITEVAVASRIKAMEVKGTMRVVAQLDFRALGYNILALIDVMVANRQIADVAVALSRIEQVGSVTVMLGDPAIIIQVHARDLAELRDLIVNEVATIAGVKEIETNLILDISKWRPGSGELSPIAN